jgi:hypothetical protein
MTWFSEYYTKTDFDTEIINKYKHHLITEDETNLLEQEYTNSVNKINTLADTDNLDSYLTSQNSLILLEYELDIIRLLSKYTLQNNYLIYDFFLKCINLLLQISNILSTRLKLEDVIHKVKNDTNYISRCSYKFCNFKNECFYNYNAKTKNVCYQDHYVHNMVSADLIILLDYIDVKYNKNNLIIPNKEILKTINTLNFVIEHMHSELKSRCLYLNENEYEKEHIIKKC